MTPASCRCSFCARWSSTVGIVLSHPSGVAICGDCVAICVATMAHAHAAADLKLRMLEGKGPERLGDSA